MTVEELAQLPALVRALQAEVADLRAQVATLKPANDTEPLIDADAAAEFLGTSPVAVRAAARRGTLPVVRFGRRLRFRRSQLARANGG